MCVGIKCHSGYLTNSVPGALIPQRVSYLTTGAHSPILRPPPGSVPDLICEFQLQTWTSFFFILKKHYQDICHLGITQGLFLASFKVLYSPFILEGPSYLRRPCQMKTILQCYNLYQFQFSILFRYLSFH